MANNRRSSKRYEYAEVDTTPGAPGYFTNPISLDNKPNQRASFSIRGTGDVTVSLQFRCPEEILWTDYVNADVTFTNGTRFQIEDFSQGVEWRAGVISDANYTSGSVVFGFDW